MVLSGVSSSTAQIPMAEMPKQEQQYVAKETSKKEVERMMSTEQYVRQYFKDIPIMIQVAKCESRFRHLDPDGEIHRGELNNKDVGVMQINEYYHLDTAEKENYNIYTIEGNTAYARELYEKQGTQPWISSKACWGKYENKDLALNNTKQTAVLAIAKDSRKGVFCCTNEIEYH